MNITMKHYITLPKVYQELHTNGIMKNMREVIILLHVLLAHPTIRDPSSHS
jgi:hypothetical protein